MRPGLIITDMQNDFVSQNGSFSKMGFEVRENARIIDRIAQFKRDLKAFKIPTIYTVCAYENQFLSDTIRERFKRNNLTIPFAITGTWGAKIADAIKPGKKDFIISKHRYSAFVGTDLKTLLTGLQIDTLIFTGIEAYVCLGLTAIHGYMLDFKIIIIEDCSASINKKEHKIALDYCRRYYGITKTSKEVIEILKNH